MSDVGENVHRYCKLTSYIQYKSPWAQLAKRNSKNGSGKRSSF